MAWFRSRPAPGRLFLTRSDGRSLRREVDPELILRFAARLREAGGAEERAHWEALGQANSSTVQRCWPEDATPPLRAMLGAGERGGGPWLEAAYPRGVDLERTATDLLRALAGVRTAAAIVPEAVEEPPAPAVPPRIVPPMVIEARPEPKPEPPKPKPTIPTRAPSPPKPAPPPPAPPSPPPPPPQPAPSAPLPSESAPPRPESLPEVLAPGARLVPARGATLRPRSDDVFGLWGDSHPDDLAGDSPELREEDLPWLCPGDRLYSPRHGRCRLLAVPDGAGRWRLRDEQGREATVSSAELTAEFSFDDGPGA